MTDSPSKKQTRLSWIILALSVVNVVFLAGKRRAFGSFVAKLHKEYSNMSLSELNWIGDTHSAISYISTSPFTSIIVGSSQPYEIFQLIGTIFVLLSSLSSSFVPNPHWLFLTFSVLHGVGSGIILSTIHLVIADYFNQNHPYRLLATTLISGGSVSALIFVSMFAAIIQAISWRMGFIVLGVMYFIVNGSGALVFSRNEDAASGNEQTRMSCQCKESISFKYLLLLILWFFERFITSTVNLGLFLNLTDYVYRTQVNLVSSIVLTTLLSTGEFSAYLVWIAITAVSKNLFRNRLRYILMVSSALMSLCLFLLEFFSQFHILQMCLCFITGVCLAPSITFLFPAGEELTRLPGHIAFPFTLCGMGCGMLMSPVLSSIIADRFQYRWFFFTLAVLFAIKVVILSLSIMLLKLFWKDFDDFQIDVLPKTENSDVSVESEGLNEAVPLSQTEKNQIR